MQNYIWRNAALACLATKRTSILSYAVSGRCKLLATDILSSSSCRRVSETIQDRNDGLANRSERYDGEQI